MTRLFRNDQTRSAVELAVVLILTEVWLWSSAANGLYRILSAIVIAAIVIKVLIRKKHDATKFEQPLWNASQSWIVIITITCALSALTLIGAGLLYSEGEQLRVGRFERLFNPKVLVDKTFIVIFQQIILCGFIFPLYHDVFRRRTVALAAASATFGILHLPSIFLVCLTVAMAAIWLHLYERSRRLTPLIVSHLVLVIIAATALPERLAYNLAVGQNALPSAHLYRQLTEGADADKYARFKSNTYYEMHGSDDPTYIRALYRDILGRKAADAEVDVWLPTLRQNSRADAVAIFLSSPEYLSLRCRRDDACNPSQESAQKHQARSQAR